MAIPEADEPREAGTRREGRALGSPLRLTVEPGPDDELIDRAWAAVRGVFDDVDGAMSRFRDDSELTALNRAGQLEAPSRCLVSALSAADRAARMTNWRFEPRVATDLERLGFGGVRQSWSDAEERPLSTTRSIRRGGRQGPIEVTAAIDLGGIGKGLALRWAAKRAAILLGDSGFLLDAGGDLVSRGLLRGARWSIGVEDPRGVTGPIAVIVLERDQAIATSSVRLGRRTDAAGREVHHLIDPTSGQPGGAGLAAVTVAWPDPAWAEVWSKALFLEGKAGIADAARRRGLAAWWVSDSGELSMTPAARQLTSWVRAEAVEPA